MKKYLFMILAFTATLMFSCKENPYMPAPGDTTYVPDTMPEMAHPDPTPDPEGAIVPEGTLNVFEARKLCSNLASGAVTEEKYYVKGWIHKLDGKNEDGITSFGNATFYFSATNDGKTDDEDFEAYQVYGKDGKKIKRLDEVQVGDFVVIYGQLTNYNNKAFETVGKGAAYIYYSNNPNFGKDPDQPIIDPTKITPDPDGADVPEGTLNVYEAREVALALASGATTTDEYYVKGWVSKLDSKHESGVTGYGNGTFYITPTNDGTTAAVTFEAFQVYGKNKQKLTSADQVAVGDFVVLKGKLTNYNGTPETVGKGAAYIYYSTNPKW